jgi:two-component system phosphate regulon sensor histidine kinase PhoR
MKGTFKIIFLLIAISLLGIIYVQVKWIESTLKLKRDQYSIDVSTAMQNVKDNIISRKNEKAIGYNPFSPALSMDGSVSVKTVINNFELKDLIRTELKKKQIRQSFEYCIINESRSPILFSTGFKSENFEDNNIKFTNLTPDLNINQEILYLYIIQPENYIQNQLFFMLMGALLFTAVIIAAFVITLRTLITQKKLSEIKSNFINNMTHEFKTPIATISLASDALTNAKVISNEDQIRYYSGIIKEENKRMNKQVEKILQAAQLEKEELKLNLQKVNVHEMIQKVANNTKLQLEEINAQLSLNFHGDNPFIMADEVHFSNILFNLIDNAIKYSKGNLLIEINTKSIVKNLEIKIKDNGIGMNKETQQHLFEKFYRANTGNMHNVKGFGLGLSYVKSIVEAHQGKISVQSELGKYSIFTLVFEHA